MLDEHSTVLAVRLVTNQGERVLLNLRGEKNEFRPFQVYLCESECNMFQLKFELDTPVILSV